MQIVTFNNYKKPKSEYCIIISHQDRQPYVDKWNYFKNISINSFKNYCEIHDIDLIIIDDFKRAEYISTEAPNFNQRNTNYPFVATKIILNDYNHVLLSSSNTLILKHYPHFKTFIREDQETFDSISTRGPYPSNDSVDINIFHKYGWFGHTSIVNKNMSQFWFDQIKLLKYKMHDLFYRFKTLNQYKDLVKMKILEDKYILNNNYWAILSMIELNKQRLPINQFSMFKWIKGNVNYQNFLTDQKFVCSFFGGCGSYSNIWKLRYLLMDWNYKKYKNYYY